MTDPKRYRLGYFDDERCKLYDHPEGEFVTHDDYAALRRLASSDGGVKVRELEWVEREGVTGTFDANTSIGHYIATITDDDRGMWFIVGQTTGEYMRPEIRAVRGAAQADYEARIKSALVEPPSAPHQGAHQAAHAEKEKTNDTVQDGRSDHSVGMHSSGRRRFDEGEIALRLHDRENHQAEQQSEIAEPRPEVVWRNGPPPKPWCDEWFIAETTYGARVVLTALPDEYTYDFKTADETYIKATNIKRWMQFPDSEFTAPPADAGMRRALERIQAACNDPVSYGRSYLTDKIAHIAYVALTAPGATTKPDGPASQPQLVATDQLAGANTANGPSEPSSTRSEVTCPHGMPSSRRCSDCNGY